MESDLVELLESEVDLLINKAHKSLNYWQIFKVFLNRCLGLMAQSEVEFYAKGGK